MCRIAGIIDTSSGESSLKEDVTAMCRLMEKGGPDGWGIYSEAGLALGHRRLSIIDLSSNGAQPMSPQNGNLVISYNGEIYNYREIKAQLVQKGYEFYSDSDTEVILMAFREWGTAAFNLFKGMFAFALLDREQKQLYLVRDHAGIKPLYYSYSKGRLYFASEVRAFDRKLFTEDASWKIRFLSYGFIPEPYTTLKDVYTLPKGSFLKYDIQTGQHESGLYQQESYVTLISDAEEARRLLEEKLAIAVRRHLIADAPIGLFLSGGIDSALLTLLASKETDQLNTLSVIFDEEGYSEKKYQQLIADQVQSNHHFLKITRPLFDEKIENVLQEYDQPSNDGINTWFISQFAKQQGLKAVLSGLGADELFGGYPSFERIGKALMLANNSGVAQYLSYFPFRKFNRFEFLKLDREVSVYLLLRGFFAPGEVASLLGISLHEVIDTLNDHREKIPAFKNYRQMASYLERNVYMQCQLLKDTDSMSMRHGIEIRVPFLDKDLMQFIDAVDPAIVYSDPGTKKLLIDTFKGVLPQEIYNRPKKGFTFPFQQWLKGSGYTEQLRSSGNPVIKNTTVGFYKDQVHWSKVWALIQLRNAV